LSRISPMFDALKEEGRAAFIPYITAGDPSLDQTEAALDALVEAGADLIELGIPFTDPMADGPTIQAASQRALKNNIRIEDILHVVSKFRKNHDTPLILFGYYNPIFVYGERRLVKDAKAAGADGFLCVDLPPDEGEELRYLANKEDMDVIYLLAPTSTPERRKFIAERASGFIYYVSVTGVTGARADVRKDIGRHVAEIRKVSDLPIAVGFGISTPEHVREVAGIADGVVVGSAIVKVMETVGDTPELAAEVAKFARYLRAGIKVG